MLVAEPIQFERANKTLVYRNFFQMRKRQAASISNLEKDFLSFF